MLPGNVSLCYCEPMPKSKAHSRKAEVRREVSQPKSKKWIFALALILTIGMVATAVILTRSGDKTQPSTPAQATNSAASPQPSAPTQPIYTSPDAPAMEEMEVAKAVMVTVELDFGPKVPSIAEALGEVDRRYYPDDGRGRTFAILDAYGEPTPDGKLLHMSMHVSSEKPGVGQLIFKRTGKILWQSRIMPSTRVLPPKNLTVLIDAGGGKSYTLDGSSNPPSALDAMVKELGRPLRDVWAEGEQKELTFIYSACGCPVKVMAVRNGNRTPRTKDTPVIFPDDPEAVTVIRKLMGW
jgi:hypothetical protein